MSTADASQVTLLSEIRMGFEPDTGIPTDPVLLNLRSYVRFDDAPDDSHAGGRQWVSRASFTYVNGGGDTVKPNVRESSGGTPDVDGPLLNGKASLNVAALGVTEPITIGAFGATADNHTDPVTLFGSTTPEFTVQMIAQIPPAAPPLEFLLRLEGGSLFDGMAASSSYSAGLSGFYNGGPTPDAGASGALRHAYNVPLLITLRRVGNVYSIYFGEDATPAASFTHALAYEASMMCKLLSVYGGTGNAQSIWMIAVWNRALTDTEAFVDNVAYYTSSANWEGLST